jgi:Skp family chaperone for outer membrane proteins
MKKVLVFVLLLSCFSLQAQENDSIPMKNGKVCISEVIQLENTSATLLYERAKIWISKSFNSARNVIQSDVPNSSLSIKAISTLPNVVEGGVLN